MRRKDRRSPLIKDALIILAGIAISIALVESDVIIRFISSAQEYEFLGSFIAGMFFTSIFTTAPAIGALAEISEASPLWSTALFGAIGAVIGDLIIFRFVRDRFSDHFMAVVGGKGVWSRLVALFRLRAFRWVTFLVGGLIIASPFPDEIGIGMLGMSKMKLRGFILLSFACNFFGIILIGLVARAV